MTKSVLADNDIVIKICAYECALEFLDLTTLDGQPPAVLAVARHSISSRIARSKSFVNKAIVQNEWDRLVPELSILEPTEDEVALAADYELQAIESSLQLDTGESQLFAVLISRSASFLLTGDKRAIYALEQLAPPSGYGKVICLEQFLLALLNKSSVETMRSRICAEPMVDRTAAICFSCSSTTVSAPAVFKGLNSYISDLRKHSPKLLSNDALSIVP